MAKTKDIKIDERMFRISSLTVGQVEDLVLIAIDPTAPDASQQGHARTKKIVLAGLNNASAGQSAVTDEHIRSLSWEEFISLRDEILDFSKLGGRSSGEGEAKAGSTSSVSGPASVQ